VTPQSRARFEALIAAIEDLLFEECGHQTPDQAVACLRGACRSAGAAWQQALDYLTAQRSAV
jgi:hypothetical protein